MPQASFRHTAHVEAPTSEVWAALDRPETWNSIPGVERVHQPVIDESGKLRGFSFDTVVGSTTYEGRATPRYRDEGRAVSWDIANSQVRGRIDVEVESANAGTHLTVSLAITSASLLAGMFFGAISRAVTDGFPQMVEDLAGRLGKAE